MGPKELNFNDILPFSNQRSVIAKIVDHQSTIPEAAKADLQVSSPRFEQQQQQRPQFEETTSVYGSSQTPPHLMNIDSQSPPPHHGTILTNSNFVIGSDYYDLIYGYELLKAKRKPIPVPCESKDDAYWERRRRNNESAKRSREVRRYKEVQTNKRIMHLEQENVKLQAEVNFLRGELNRLRENELIPFFHVHRPFQ